MKGHLKKWKTITIIVESAADRVFRQIMNAALIELRNIEQGISYSHQKNDKKTTDEGNEKRWKNRKQKMPVETNSGRRKNEDDAKK